MKKIGIALACLLMAVGCCACGATEEQPLDVNVYMPDGAPALALAGMMATDTQDDGVNYRVVDAKLIASKVTNQDGAKNADLCVMPITAASKLLGGGAKYTMLGAVTHGNLYLLAKEGAYTQENLASLVGKKVGVLQINEVPGLTFKAVLSKHGIAWQELTNDGTMDETKVNLVALADASAVATVEADCYMIAEPAASAQVQKNGFVLAGSVCLSFISPFVGLFTSALSRKFEYAADKFAVDNGCGPELISGLKKLVRNSFGTLSPHPVVVALTYSHPPISQRLAAMEKRIESQKEEVKL